MKAPSLGIDPVVALVGGGGLALSALPTLLVWHGGSDGFRLVAALAFAVALAVLAVGLPGRRGAFQDDRLTRGSVLVAAGLTVIVTVLDRVLGSLASRGSDTLSSAGFESVGFKVVASVGFMADLAIVVALVVGAIGALRSRGIARDAALGLVVLAVAAILTRAVPGVVLRVAYPSFGQGVSDLLFWLARLFALLTVATGVWFAWPWLGSRVASGRSALSRVYRRYVDSTP